MAADNFSQSNKAKIKEENKILYKNNSKVRLKSKRRYQVDEDGGESTSEINIEMQNLIAKELSVYLDMNIEEVAVDCQEDIAIRQEQANDFQVYSAQLRKSCASESPLEKENSPFPFQNHKGLNITDSSSGEEDDGETYARFQEAAVSVQDIFQYRGPTCNSESKKPKSESEKKHCTQ